MDRVYVKHQNKTPVHQLGLNKWRDVVVRDRRIKERLLKLLLEHVQRERTGELIDRNLMRSITQVGHTEPAEICRAAQGQQGYRSQAGGGCPGRLAVAKHQQLSGSPSCGCRLA